MDEKFDEMVFGESRVSKGMFTLDVLLSIYRLKKNLESLQGLWCVRESIMM